jgi:hypothetical protein
MNDSGPKHHDQSSDDELVPAFLVPKNFRFGPVTVAAARSSAGLSPRAQFRHDDGPKPSLKPLDKLTGVFQGNGFNTIFLPHFVGPKGISDDPGGTDDNVLQLNLTEETLSFTDTKRLENVPNRGLLQQDIFFAGVAYLQFIQDVTGLDPDKKEPPGIHFEPGLWMSVGETEAPAQRETLMRMASIPHGTTVLAQGTSVTTKGPPVIPPVSIVPLQLKTFEKVENPLTAFPSLDASQSPITRIPQDLKDGRITQEMLDNPNSLLKKKIDSQNIQETTTITISTEPRSLLLGTDPASPLFGGGTNNMAFLSGEEVTPPPDDDATAHPNANAQTLGMRATFWIETLEDNSTQIQYSQEVFLNFKGLIWPHVSVATLTQTKK